MKPESVTKSTKLKALIKSLDKKLKAFGADYTSLELRGKVLRLVDIYQNVRDLNVKVVRESGCDARGARERLRLYFVHNVGVVLDATELEVVSGISEYARRIRELRVEDGYSILTGNSSSPDSDLELKPDQYILIKPEPDLEAAHRWHIANRIRNDEDLTSAKSRILEYLKANVGKVVTSEELFYVAKDKNWARRTREIRTEMGYAVCTRFTGRPDLRSGEYVLESPEPGAPAHDRNIPIDVQKIVYARDGNTCRVCGWNHDLWTRQDPRFLELHHVREHVEGGKNEADNLIVACNICHDGIHAGRVDLADIVPGVTD